MSISESEPLDDLQPRAFAIAHRMLGSVSEAEDIVQEALVRIHEAIERGEEISSIVNPEKLSISARWATRTR